MALSFGCFGRMSGSLVRIRLSLRWLHPAFRRWSAHETTGGHPTAICGGVRAVHAVARGQVLTTKPQPQGMAGSLRRKVPGEVAACSGWWRVRMGWAVCASASRRASGVVFTAVPTADLYRSCVHPPSHSGSSPALRPAAGVLLFPAACLLKTRRAPPQYAGHCDVPGSL